ncbi:MAG: YhdP family protein [Burkholderiales bacterium]
MTQYRIFSRPRQKQPLLGRFRWLGVGTLWAYRILTWSLLAIGLAFAGAVLALRHWVFPNIDAYREDIARIVSERARQKVTIGAIHAQWDGLRPQLVLERVTVHDAAGRPALELTRVDNTLSWLSVPALELRFHALDIYRPTLGIRRDARGVVSIAGVELADGGGGNGFADWLLRQREIEIHDATIIWNDELREAPELALKNVHLHLLNGFSRHRFGLRATPPRELAAPLDLRGDLRGGSVAALSDWNGKLFVQLDYADIAAWRTWVPFPIELPRGAGAVRAWLTFSRNQLVEAIADVKLTDVNTRLAADLPQLDLSHLSGRLGWKQFDEGFEVTTSSLRLTTTGGLALPPADFLLRLNAADQGGRAGGELRANALELAPLVALADHLPLGQEMRGRLAEYSPRGSLRDVVMRWSGEWREPRQYSVRGRFQRLALKRAGKVPGFTGASGTVEANERGGTLFLNSQNVTVEMPLVFGDAHELEALSAQISWSRGGGETELWINNIAFANAHLAGSVFGVYRTAGATSGAIDLTGRLTRADARFVSRYIPLAVAAKTREWLDAAFLAGRSSNVTLRLKGNLDDYPFHGGRSGVFQVTARVADGVLHFANGWPDITNIAGDLVFRGNRMDLHAWEAAISGVRLARVRAEIADMAARNEILHISGEAEGPSGDFLAFIAKSPVSRMIDDFTRGWQVQGAGRLGIKLSIPLRDTAKSTIAGAYQFAGNTLTLSPGLPRLEQAGGRVEFTETTVRAQNVKGVVLGGPVTISATTGREGAVRIGVQGRINADVARRTGGPYWVQNLRGATDWRATLTARKRNADLLVESNLQGLAVNLPAPLVKTAAETWPARFERRSLADGQDRLSLAVGDIVSMILVRRVEGEEATIARGAVRLGGAATEPDRNGVWVTGAVKALDADGWLARLGQGEGGTRVHWGGIDVSLGAMDALGLRFGGHSVKASLQDGQWRAALSGRELDGEVTWQPEGAGKVVARMAKFAIPAGVPGADAAASREPQTPTEPQELPALDIVADQFIIKDRVYGRLELGAVSEGRDWRVERLVLSNPESNLALDGVWRRAQARQVTQVNLRLETSDSGKLLARLGHPEGVQGGVVKLEGSLTWNGVPYELDYPTMSGVLSLEAAKGQFVKLDPGIGKLLGVMSLQSLPRRVTLDFRDVFSEGFAFDEITGATRIDRGTATTGNFRVRGPAATIVMKGSVNLAQETQNLRVRITPQVTESVAVAGALVGGPIAGVAAYLAQKVLRDPVGKLASFEYDVSGTWSDPMVKRVARPAPEPAPDSE